MPGLREKVFRLPTLQYPHHQQHCLKDDRKFPNICPWLLTCRKRSWVEMSSNRAQYAFCRDVVRLRSSDDKQAQEKDKQTTNE